jgi:hypothetical protein
MGVRVGHPPIEPSVITLEPWVDKRANNTNGSEYRSHQNYVVQSTLSNISI